MFDPNEIPYPLCPELAPSECAYLVDKLYNDLSSLEDRPYEITLSANCFDALPRTWQFTPISDMDTEVFGPAEGHKITVNVCDMYGFNTVAENKATLCPTEDMVVWNSDIAVLELAEAIASTWAAAAAAYMKYMFDHVGFDSETFLTVTNDNVTTSEQFQVMMGWGAIYEMRVILDDPTTETLVGDFVYSGMQDSYRDARNKIEEATDHLLNKATTVALETLFNQEDSK